MRPGKGASQWAATRMGTVRPQAPKDVAAVLPHCVDDNQWSLNGDAAEHLQTAPLVVDEAMAGDRIDAVGALDGLTEALHLG